MEREDSPYCQCLYYASNALARIMTRMADDAFASVGLSSSYAFLLMTVNNKPGIQPKEISQKMQLTPSTVTRLIEKMEVRGMLERQSSGRATTVFPTPQSLELQPKILLAWRQLYEKYSGILGEQEGIVLTASIHEATKKLE
ncbi:MAG: winged helix-turn-helix transcriptional regulator [Lewinellaceae bacterium]|nr:winged helix-turn-helix transcriptional regulator [Lewinellaceae bacterium]